MFFCLSKKEIIALQHSNWFHDFFVLLSNIFIQLQSQSQIRKDEVFSRWFFLDVMRAVKTVFPQDLIAKSVRNWKNMLLKLQIEKHLVMKREGYSNVQPLTVQLIESITLRGHGFKFHATVTIFFLLQSHKTLFPCPYA